jgi:hypothetical protein
MIGIWAVIELFFIVRAASTPSYREDQEPTGYDRIWRKPLWIRCGQPAPVDSFGLLPPVNGVRIISGTVAVTAGAWIVLVVETLQVTVLISGRLPARVRVQPVGGWISVRVGSVVPAAIRFIFARVRIKRNLSLRHSEPDKDKCDSEKSNLFHCTSMRFTDRFESSNPCAAWRLQ